MSNINSVQFIIVTGKRSPNGYFYFNQQLLEKGVMLWYAGNTLEAAIREFPVYIWFDDHFARLFKGIDNRRDQKTYNYVSPEEIVTDAANILEDSDDETSICNRISFFLSSSDPKGYIKSYMERQELREKFTPVIEQAQRECITSITSPERILKY